MQLFPRMNSDSPKTPREEMEAWLTSLLLGELSEGEAAAVRELMKHDAELAKLHDRLKESISLVRETVPQMEAPPAEPLKLSAEKRQRLLTAFKIPPLKKEHQKPKPFLQFKPLEVFAVVAIIALIAAISFPALNSMKRMGLSQSDVLEEGRSIRPEKAQVVTTTDAGVARFAGEAGISRAKSELVTKLSEPSSNVYSLGVVGYGNVAANATASEDGRFNSLSALGNEPAKPTPAFGAQTGTPPPQTPDGVYSLYANVDAAQPQAVTASGGSVAAVTPWKTIYSVNGSSAPAAPGIVAATPPPPVSAEPVVVGGNVTAHFAVPAQRPTIVLPSEKPGDAGGFAIAATAQPQSGRDWLDNGRNAAAGDSAPADAKRYYRLKADEFGVGGGGGGNQGGGRPAEPTLLYDFATTPPPQTATEELADTVRLQRQPSVDPATGLPVPLEQVLREEIVLNDDAKKTPIFGDLPSVGKLFRSEDKVSGAADQDAWKFQAPDQSLAAVLAVPEAETIPLRYADGVDNFTTADFETGKSAAKQPEKHGFSLLGPANAGDEIARSDAGGFRYFLDLSTNAIAANGTVTRGTEALGVSGANQFRGGTAVTLGSGVRGLEEIQQQKGLATDNWYGANKVVADGDHDSSVRYRELSQLGGEKKLALDDVSGRRSGDRVDALSSSSTIVLPTDPAGISGDGLITGGLRPPPQPRKPARPDVALSIAGKSESEVSRALEREGKDLFQSGKFAEAGEKLRAATKADGRREISGKEKQIAQQAQKVEALRKQLKISDTDAAGAAAPMMIEGESFRRLNGQLIEGKARLRELQVVNDKLSVLSKDELKQVLPRVAPDAHLNELLSQQNLAEQQLVKLKADFSTSHPEYKHLENQARELDRKVESAVLGTMITLSNQVQVAQAGVSELEKAVSDAQSLDIPKAQGARLYFDEKRRLDELLNEKRLSTSPNESDPTPIRKPSTNAPIPQPEIQTSENSFSTFSLNVSDVSFKLAAASLGKGQMPDAASVRSEEFINTFDYRDPEPAAGAPIAFAWERARYPFAHNRDLLRFSLKTAAAGRQAGRPLNIVLLLDNSGSMERADRVQIIREGLRGLASQLQTQDKLSVITFARTPRLVADGISGDKAGEVTEAVAGLTPQGGTNLEDAMNLAYQTAAKHYLANGINRVVVLTDGAANLGNVEPESLKQKVEAQRKQGIALDCFGIGWEGLNDDLLEALSRNGDGRYGFINSPEEAATDFVGQLAGALHVAASDVKVQVEFNPKRTTAYRQIGYAKHQLTKEQFRDNAVDAAEIAAQETGNALYTVEVNPSGEGPLCTVRVRYKIPGTTDYREQAWDVPYTGNACSLEQASPAMRLAASAAAFAEWLVASPFAGEVTPDRLLGVLSGVPEVYGADSRPKKLEWMIRQAKSLEGK